MIIPKAVEPITGTENADQIFEAARLRGERGVERIAILIEANELERKTISALEAKVRHGYKFIDIIVRKDGVETRFEGDWLARLFRAEGMNPK